MWLAAQAASEVFTTTITLAEIFYGIETLPAGKRRMRLLAAVEKMFAEQFGGRILPFDEESARIVSSRDSAGHPISQFDAMIAAIARSHRATVSTQNTSDFVDCGITIVDP